MKEIKSWVTVCHDVHDFRTVIKIRGRAGHRPQSSTRPLYTRACQAPGCRMEMGRDWACILLGLTSHCLLWSQQNGLLGPHLQRQTARINSRADCAPLFTPVSGGEERGRCSLQWHLWRLSVCECGVGTWYMFMILYYRNADGFLVLNIFCIDAFSRDYMKLLLRANSTEWTQYLQRQKTAKNKGRERRESLRM